MRFWLLSLRWKIICKPYRWNHIFFTPGGAYGTQRRPSGHLEVAATVKKWAQNSPENEPNLSDHTHSRNTKIADFIACKNWIKIELLEIAYFPIPGVSMGLQRSIWKPKKEPKIPPKRTALTRRRPPNCAKTVRGLVLATPDELENDNMRVGKLRLRSTTFREHWSVQ